MATRVWRRYGQLRIYVLSGELEVGWSDPLSGRYQLNRPEFEELFWAEVEAESERLRRGGRLPALDPTALDPTALDPTALDPTAPDPTALGPSAPDPTDPDLPPVDHVVSAGIPCDDAVPAGVPSDDAVLADADLADADLADLATNRPGAAASAHARHLRRERPVRTAAASILRIRTPARSFAIGAAGERVVGRRLDRWANRYGWHVLHAIPVGRHGADIDHVVIGPFGVVTINTKSTSTSVWVGEYGMVVGGTKVDYIRNSRSEADRARRLLARAAGVSVPVRSAIVFVGARRFTLVRGGPPDVAVLRSPRALLRWLRCQQATLAAHEVAATYDLARQRATWQPARHR